MSHHVCGAELELQHVYLTALCVVPVDLPPAEPGEVHDVLRCVLQAGHSGSHHGLARSLPLRHPGEVWCCWSSGRQPAGLLRLPDCPRTSPADRDLACVLFDGHEGAHSWALADPDDEELRTRLGLHHPDATGTTGTAPACPHRRTEEREGRTHCRACGRRVQP